MAFFNFIKKFIKIEIIIIFHISIFFFSFFFLFLPSGQGNGRPPTSNRPGEARARRQVADNWRGSLAGSSETRARWHRVRPRLAIIFPDFASLLRGSGSGSKALLLRHLLPTDCEDVCNYDDGEPCAVVLGDGRKAALAPDI